MTRLIPKDSKPPSTAASTAPAPGWRRSQQNGNGLRLAPAVASLDQGEPPGGDAPAAAPTAVVAHVPARGVGRFGRRVALLDGDGHPARHARRVVRLHPRRPRRRRRRRQESRCMQREKKPRARGVRYTRTHRACTDDGDACVQRMHAVAVVAAAAARRHPAGLPARVATRTARAWGRDTETLAMRSISQFVICLSVCAPAGWEVATKVACLWADRRLWVRARAI